MAVVASHTSRFSSLFSFLHIVEVVICAFAFGNNGDNAAQGSNDVANSSMKEAQSSNNAAQSSMNEAKSSMNEVQSSMNEAQSSIID